MKVSLDKLLVGGNLLGEFISLREVLKELKTIGDLRKKCQIPFIQLLPI